MASIDSLPTLIVVLLACLCQDALTEEESPYYRKSKCGNYFMEILHVDYCGEGIVAEQVIDLNDATVELDGCRFIPKGQPIFKKSLGEGKIMAITEGSVESSIEMEYGCESVQQIDMAAPSDLAKRLIFLGLGVLPIAACPLPQGPYLRIDNCEEDLENNRDKISKLEGNLTMFVQVYDLDEPSLMTGCIRVAGRFTKDEPKAGR